MKIEDYYLDLDKVSKLESVAEKSVIHDYYRDMMNSYLDGRTKQAQSIMNTLVRGGYLKNVTQEERDEKIEVILG